MSPPSPDRGARQRLDLTEQPFGLLVAKERLPKLPGSQGERWRCVCACGGAGGGAGETVARVKDLRSGNTRSCGCLTNRPRRVADQPHRATDAGLYAAIKEAVWNACAAGQTMRGAGIRSRFDGRASRSTLYRLIRQAQEAWEVRQPGAEPPA